jgi:RNA polymerase sigma-70 factor (ECF subfamily)
MDKNVYHLKIVGLVTRARQGDEQSLAKLAELVEGRLYAYIYRLTLDGDLTSDLLQETLLEMVRTVKDLREPEAFWCWLFRTAWGKVQHYYRTRNRRRTIPFSALAGDGAGLESLLADAGLDDINRKELSEAVFEAIEHLSISHRSVVALRCFEQMQYAEIAELMDCSELRARVLFHRAKMALRKRLSRRGFTKAYLLAALGLFGLFTTPAKAASTAGTVTATTLEVGPLAAAIGALGSKLGVAAATAVTAAIVAISIKQLLYVLAGIIVFLFVFSFICLVKFYE